MTPEQAIEILDNIAAQVALPRRQHEIAMEAVVLLKKVVAESQPAATNGAEQPAAPAT